VGASAQVGRISPEVSFIASGAARSAETTAAAMVDPLAGAHCSPKQQSWARCRFGDIPAAAFLSPREFARLCRRAAPWRGPRRAPVANGMMMVGTKATELAVAAGAAMLVAGGRRPG
jgi:hypothetical protein